MNRAQRRAESKRTRPSPTVPHGFAEALRHHQAGRLDEAERLYRQGLTTEPRHADSLHLLGVVALPDRARRSRQSR